MRPVPRGWDGRALTFRRHSSLFTSRVAWRSIGSGQPCACHRLLPLVHLSTALAGLARRGRLALEPGDQFGIAGVLADRGESLVRLNARKITEASGRSVVQGGKRPLDAAFPEQFTV